MQEAVEKLKRGGSDVDIIMFRCLQFFWIADDGATVVPAGDLSEMNEDEVQNLVRIFENFVRYDSKFLDKTMPVCLACAWESR